MNSEELAKAVEFLRKNGKEELADKTEHMKDKLEIGKAEIEKFSESKYAQAATEARVKNIDAVSTAAMKVLMGSPAFQTIGMMAGADAIAEPLRILAFAVFELGYIIAKEEEGDVEERIDDAIRELDEKAELSSDNPMLPNKVN